MHELDEGHNAAEDLYNLYTQDGLEHYLGLGAKIGELDEID